MPGLIEAVDKFRAESAAIRSGVFTSRRTGIAQALFRTSVYSPVSPLSFRPENPILTSACQIDAKKERLQELPKVQIVSAENRKLLVEESSELRKKVRGESVGGSDEKWYSKLKLTTHMPRHLQVFFAE
jgi:hypothetical protein